MAYFVERVVICDAYREPNRHYQLLDNGRSKLVEGVRRPSMRFLSSAKDTGSGLAGIRGKKVALFDDLSSSATEQNEFVNDLREDIRSWRNAGYPSISFVTRRLLEWWFERDEERMSTGKRFFFCQREAMETLIYLYEVKKKHRMPGTGDILRYAFKLATGTGKTVVMAMLIVWSTLHKRKVSGSSLSANFLVLVPNLTVRDRVSGIQRGDGLDIAGEQNLYHEFQMVPPEYRDVFSPNVMVKNWQSIRLDAKRDDWVCETDIPVENGRFISHATLQAMRRRSRSDPNTGIRMLLKGKRDLLVINDEAHHVYGKKQSVRDEVPQYIRWSRIIERISSSLNLSLVVDLSATPWYGSGSPKPEGTLFEWLVSDFSVYDAFESGLVKIVRLPDPKDTGKIYIDLWGKVKEAKTKSQYLQGCQGAVASIYSSYKQSYEEWESILPELRSSPNPVLLCVTNDSKRAKWLFEHLSSDFELLRNEGDDPANWATIQIDTKVFDADKGKEATLREMVSTVGSSGKIGEHVRAIISVNMLSEGWDVKSVTHILGLRAFGSPLLTEQIIGRGLRLTNYDILNQPLDGRKHGSEETVDAFGVPFVGFPVQKHKRSAAGDWGNKPVWIETAKNKSQFGISVPNVRSWAIGVTEDLADLIQIETLPDLVIDPKHTPPTFRMRSIVTGQQEQEMSLQTFRDEYPVLKSIFLIARELHELTNPLIAKTDLATGPIFEELITVVYSYFVKCVIILPGADSRDIGIYVWRQKAVDILQNAIRNAVFGPTAQIPILGDPEFLNTSLLKRFQWPGLTAKSKKCHTNLVPCDSHLEKNFVQFLDSANDVIRFFKNERLGFSITYYEGERSRQYFPDFLVEAEGNSIENEMWIIETKGEIHSNTSLKNEAANKWCDRISKTTHGRWRYHLVHQKKFDLAIKAGVKSLKNLICFLEKD